MLNFTDAEKYALARVILAMDAEINLLTKRLDGKYVEHVEARTAERNLLSSVLNKMYAQ